MKIPKKSLGQNFLIDKNILKKISIQTKLENENVVEIGPGYGNLTDYIISKKPKKLILIEKDRELFKYLKKKYKDQKNVNIINKDVLEYDFTKLKKIKVISNLPYNISTKIIMKLIFYNQNIISLIFMIQKELAIKFDYQKKIMNKYKFIIKLCTNYKILFDVSNKVFYPKPKVSSKVVEFIPKKINIDQEHLLNFANIIFINKRKKIKNNIKLKNNISENLLNRRVEELSFDELLEIYKFF
tara:strand:+ start:557 stop:1282 length:726 start_codon:yes stop_codon:yes gene_type:complete